MLEALGHPAGNLNFAWVAEASGQLLLVMPIEHAPSLSRRARRRPENLLSNGHCAFVTFDLQLKLGKWGLKARRGCKLGLVRWQDARSAYRFIETERFASTKHIFCKSADLVGTPVVWPTGSCVRR